MFNYLKKIIRCTKGVHRIKMHAIFFFTSFVRNVYLSDKYLAGYAQGVCRTYVGFNVKHPSLMSDFNPKWNVSINLYKTPKYKISRKSVQ
jgi:hypothetical protein